MKEGPEALVGGPPLSLSEGPALSAFRLRPTGRDTPPHLRRVCPLPHPGPLVSASPRICPVKAFVQQLSLLWCFLHGAALAGVGLGEQEGREEMKGVFQAPAFWVLPRSTLLL